METLYPHSRELLADMSPDGARVGTIRIPYAYNWPLGAAAIDWTIAEAIRLDLKIEVAPETGVLRRHGELQVSGTEAILFKFITALASELTE